MTTLLEGAIGPYGLLIVLLAFLVAVGSGKFFVPKVAHDREVQRVDRYDELVQKALANTNQALEQQGRTFAEHEKIIDLATEIRDSQRLSVEREGWARQREHGRDTRERERDERSQP